MSRSSLRKALDVLEQRGRIMRHVGRGTFVAEAGPDVVTASLRLSPPPGPADVLDLRQMIEPQIAAAAAIRATGPEIGRLSDLIEAAAAASDWAGWERLDSRIHSQLAQSTRNPLAVGVLDTLQVIRRQEEWGALRRKSIDPERQAFFSAQHRRLAERIAARDAAGAAEEMRAHLDSVRKAMTGQSLAPPAAGPDTPGASARPGDAGPPAETAPDVRGEASAAEPH